MLSPATLNRVSSSYRRGYCDGYELREGRNLPVPTTDNGIPLKPFSDTDYTSGRAAGLNDRYWSDYRAGRETRTRAEFMASHGLALKTR
jgi:hypothetical protein